jgi:hypothetical protein
MSLNKIRATMVAGIFMLGLIRVQAAPAKQLAHVLAKETLSVSATELDSQPAIDWMELLYNRVEAEAINAPSASRLYAYGGITLYQAVFPGIPGTVSLAGQLQDMPDTPAPDATLQYDWSAAATAALSVVLPGILPTNSKGATDTANTVKLLRERQLNARIRDVGKDIVDRSVTYGEAVGQAILAWEKTDHYTEIKAEAYQLPTGDDSYWIPTNPDAPIVEPYWGKIRTFGLTSADICDVKLGLPFNADKNSTFYAQAMEVKTVGDNLTQEQKDIARRWIDTPGQTGAPSGHWVEIEGIAAKTLKLKLDKTAMMYALTNIAVGDAFIATWSLKYQVLLVRPVTYIQKYIDKQWKPFVATPNFPEYPSGHSVASAAAAEVLTTLFGPVAFTDDSVKKHQLQVRSYTSFWAAADEAAISRLYGGIHYRNAIEAGLQMGQLIGQYDTEHVKLTASS